jgi:hypothetical protein
MSDYRSEAQMGRSNLISVSAPVHPAGVHK